jgi:hypothetical protein
MLDCFYIGFVRELFLFLDSEFFVVNTSADKRRQAQTSTRPLLDFQLLVNLAHQRLLVKLLS